MITRHQYLLIKAIFYQLYKINRFIYRLFVNFLITQGAWENYYAIMEHEASMHGGVSFREKSKNEDNIEYFASAIDCSFIWYSTPQGRSYWEDLDEKWRTLVRYYFKNKEEN